jgi:hypothetical protein
VTATASPSFGARPSASSCRALHEGESTELTRPGHAEGVSAKKRLRCVVVCNRHTFTVTVGRKISRAQYFVEDPKEVNRLLCNLGAFSSTFGPHASKENSGVRETGAD